MSQVQQLVPKDARYEHWRWQIFGVTWLAYAGFYLTRKSFAVAKGEILADPNIIISKGMMGVIEAAYLLAYAIGQFVWGISGDRFGTRRVVLMGMLASIAVGFVLGVSSILLLFGVFLFIQGLCQSTGWAPLTKNVGDWFSRKERGRAYGWWCTNYAIGGLVASAIAGYSADYFANWRFAFFVPAGVLFGIWLLFLTLQRNRPEDVGLPSIEEYHGEPTPVLEASDDPASEKEGSREAVFRVLKNPMVLRLGAVYFFLKPTRYAILLWGPLFVTEKLGTGHRRLCFDQRALRGCRAARCPLCRLCFRQAVRRQTHAYLCDFPSAPLRNHVLLRDFDECQEHMDDGHSAIRNRFSAFRSRLDRRRDLPGRFRH